MLLDQENMYIDKALTSNVIANGGGGDAADPLFLIIFANTALTAASGATAALVTSDDESFSESNTLATYTLAASKKGLLVAAKLPYGMKKYSKLTVTGATAGTLTAGLTETVPNWY